MNEIYNDWINNSKKCQDKLEKALKQHGGTDIVIRYPDVAFCFPSNEPNPYSFDYPLIDHERFIQWAESNGWIVQLAPEIASEKDKHRPPVRFTKK